MKKSVVYILVSVLLLAALAGCGEMNGTDTTPTPTSTINASATPGAGTADDDDGIITSDEGATASPTKKPDTSVSPSATVKP